MEILTADQVRGKVDFAIITIKEEEFRAVLQRFPTQTHVQGQQFYSLSSLDVSPSCQYTIAVTRSPEQGTGSAQNTAHSLIADLDPQWLMIVGIAGGLPASEYTLGDVIVATHIYDFTREAVLQDNRLEFDIVGGPAHEQVRQMISYLPAREQEIYGWNTEDSLRMAVPRVDISQLELYGPHDWQQKIRESLEKQFDTSGIRGPIRVKDGPIGSSDRLIKDTDLIQQLKPVARSLLAVEMEAAGVYRAVRRMNREYPLLTIRGISDIIGLKRDPAWTEFACHTAAAFAKAVIQLQPVRAVEKSPLVPSWTLPLLEWCQIPGGKVKIDEVEYILEPFLMSKYPVTNYQYQAFLNASDGYKNQQWWDFSPEASEWHKKNSSLKPSKVSAAQFPRTNLCWFDAQAFCGWASHKAGCRLTLPTEQQWQLAVQATDGRTFPWGNIFDAAKCNTTEGKVGKPTPVNAYPDGKSPNEVFDLAGNVWEWCLNESHIAPDLFDRVTGFKHRAIRGGSYSNTLESAASTWRDSCIVTDAFSNVGMRLVVSPQR